MLMGPELAGQALRGIYYTGCGGCFVELRVGPISLPLGCDIGRGAGPRIAY